MNVSSDERFIFISSLYHILDGVQIRGGLIIKQVRDFYDSECKLVKCDFPCKKKKCASYMFFFLKICLLHHFLCEPFEIPFIFSNHLKFFF